MTRRVFTEARFAEIARDIAGGTSPAEIAARLGCTLGTLRVRCSQAGISLRRKGPRGPRPIKLPVKPVPVAMAITLPQAIIDQLREHAATKGMTGDALAGRLLEVITTENLFAAVLDQ